MDLDLYNHSYDKFLSYLIKDNSKILEIGCGPGNISKYLLEKNNSLHILGTDVSQNMIDLARKNNPDISYQKLDARNLKNINGTFDGIIAGFVLPYLKDYDCNQFLKHTCEKLSKDGVLYLSFVVGNYKNSSYIWGSTGDKMFFCYYSVDNILSHLKDNGLVLMEQLDLEFVNQDKKTDIHTVIILKKI